MSTIEWCGGRGNSGAFHVAEDAKSFGVSLPAETLGEFRYQYKLDYRYKLEAPASDQYKTDAQGE